MRYVTIALNAVLVIFAVIVGIQEKIFTFGEPSTFFTLFGWLCLITPLSSLFQLFYRPNSNLWFSLYFQRKALEEKIRIANLEKRKS